MEHWYVYYKLPAAEVDAVAARVKPMQIALGALTRTRCRLQARTEAPHGVATLMEVYEDIADPAAFALQLSDALLLHGLGGPARQIERFHDL